MGGIFSNNFSDTTSSNSDSENRNVISSNSDSENRNVVSSNSGSLQTNESSSPINQNCRMYYDNISNDYYLIKESQEDKNCFICNDIIFTE